MGHNNILIFMDHISRSDVKNKLCKYNFSEILIWKRSASENAGSWSRKCGKRRKMERLRETVGDTGILREKGDE